MQYTQHITANRTASSVNINNYDNDNAGASSAMEMPSTAFSLLDLDNADFGFNESAAGMSFSSISYYKKLCELGPIDLK